MEYPEEEIDLIRHQDFSTYFMCSIGNRPYVIDIITIIHKGVDFDKAEQNAVLHKMENDIELRLVPYEFLKDIKLRSRREKDAWDIARLEELRNLKK